MVQFTRLTQVFNKADFDVVLLVLANNIPQEEINIPAGGYVELNYRKYMVKKTNPEMVPSIWVRRSTGELLCQNPITPEQVKDNKDIVLNINDDGESQLQFYGRTQLDQIRGYTH